MKYTLKRFAEKPFLQSKDNIVIEVNDEFTKLSGYSKNQILGKSLIEISMIIRIDSQINLENIENEYNCYMFTKEYEPRELTIFCESLECKNEKKYFFKEKPNSRIEDKFPYALGIIVQNEIGIAIYSVNDGILLKASEKLLDFMNTEFKEKRNHIGKSIKEIIPKYKGSEWEKIFLNIIKNGESYYTKDFKYEHIDKKNTYAEVSFVPIYISGKIKYIVCTIYEITERVLNRKAIEKKNQEAEAIIENIPDEIIILEKNSGYLIANKAAREDYFLHDTLTDLNTFLKKVLRFDTYGNLLSFKNLPANRVLRGEKFSNYTIQIKKNNEIIHREISGTPIYDNEGNLIAGVLVGRDIAEKLKNEKKLLVKTQYDLLTSVIENVELGLMRCSYPDFKIIDYNNICYKILKKLKSKITSLSSIKGQSLIDLLAVTEKVKFIEGIQRLVEKKESYSVNIRITISEQEEVYKMVCQPLLGFNNQIIEVVFWVVDVTKEVKAKDKMEETLKAQEEVFASIFHELKTPLNVVFSTNQLMEMYLKNNSFDDNREKISKGISVIKQNCYRFIKIINNIVDLSKIESGFFKLHMSNENIVLIIEGIIESIVTYIKDKKLSIIFDTNVEEKIIACDPTKIERIMLNLISNAIKFTDPGGQIFVNLIDRGNNVEISVKDTGIGMDKVYLDDIFKRFNQVDKSLSRNTEGSGIGLNLVKSIVELHGGKISADSKVGIGSIFKIDLPAKIIEETEVIEYVKPINNKIEMMNIEFSDIYSI